MGYTKVGACPKCGAPIWCPMVWWAVGPPPVHHSCFCAASSQQVYYTNNTTTAGQPIPKVINNANTA